MEADASKVIIREMKRSDSIRELTHLLHRAYAPLAAMGFNYTASYQSEEETLKRIERGSCYVAELDGIVGTFTIQPPGRCAPPDPYGRCEWYARPEVAVLNQLAVDPALQNCGLGSRLLEHAEEQARVLGAEELAFDTSEGAEQLIGWYRRRGYRKVGHVQWGGKTYRSLVLSKPL